jgi:8-oxo-dGTP pyrophosphatase MutT (NUDIX family)
MKFFEFPGGLIEINEEPIETARKELLQETGYRCNILNLKDGFTHGPLDVTKKHAYFWPKD